MKYNIVTIPPFDREFKRLSKKYPSLNTEVAELGKLLATNPVQGIILGNNCYKIRLSIASKGKGKRGGARVITSVYVAKETVYLLAIYDKSEQANISDKEIKERIRLIE